MRFVAKALLVRLRRQRKLQVPDESGEERELAVHVLIRFRLTDASRISTSYAVPPSLYATLAAITSVNTELFSDVINQTCAVPYFCSLDEDDMGFGSVGAWSPLRDAEFSRAVANPPFTPDLLRTCIETFNRNVSQESPYCRVEILPWTLSGAVRKILSESSFTGSILALIPPRQLGFRPYESNFTQRELDRYPPNAFLHYAIVLWCNISHAAQFPAPANA